MADYKDTIKELQDINLLLEQQKTLSLALGNLTQARAAQTEIAANQEQIIAELKANITSLTDEERELLESIEETQGNITKSVGDERDRRKNIITLIENTNKLLVKSWDYLLQSDKVIRNTIRNLGLSGTKAELMRSSFENAALHTTRLGGTLSDIQTTMEGFSDITGQARVLTAGMVEDIITLGKGTGFGVEQATKLAAQFEYMGIDINNTLINAQGIVDTSERMGVNTTKVFKNISDNFRKINTFTFKEGSKAISQMAMEAEKFRVSIESSLNAAEKAKTLEGAIEMVAQLNVMGGSFSNIDMFQAFYESRNEPQKWTKRISEMTKGIVTFRKNSDNIFEKFISPADRQRLEYAAKALGISNEELTEIAQKRAELDLSEKELAGKGFTSKQKEWIQGAMKLNSTTGKLQVTIGGVMRDISSLTNEQAKAFEQEQSTLKDRAIAAQTFDEALKATIEEFKTILLPMLRGINSVLNTIRPIAIGFNNAINNLMKTNFGSGLLKGAGALMAVGFLLNLVAKNLTLSGKSLSERLITLFKTNKVGGATQGGGSILGGGKSTSSGGSITSNPNAGKGLMRGGAGVGAAALGIGAGIGIAAAGISKLADSMSKLDKTQIAALPNTILAMAGAFSAIIIPLAIVAGVAKIAWKELIALGAAGLMIGAGIGIAAAGIGYMGEGLGNLVEKSKGAGKDFLMVAGGVAAIAGSLALFSNPLTGIGLLAFAGIMATITAASLAASSTANSISKMGIAIKGSKDDFIAVKEAIEAINNSSNKGNGVFSELAKLVKQPLKVEFADKEVALNNNITLNIDGQKFMNRNYDVRLAITRHEELKHNKAAK